MPVDKRRVQACQLQSIARAYPEGISRIIENRENIRHQEVQNRDNKSIYFWFGRVPTDVNMTEYLPDDPADWTTEQHTAAELFMKTYGLEVVAGSTKVLQTASTSAVYSYVEIGSAVAHVILSQP